LLFLIPWPWIGPVLAPLLCAVLMITTAIIIINFEDSKIKVNMNLKELGLVILGVLVILFTWLYDYGKIIFKGGFAKDFFTLAENLQFQEVISNYVPLYYNWTLFLIGLVIFSVGILLFYLRIKKSKNI